MPISNTRNLQGAPISPDVQGSSRWRKCFGRDHCSEFVVVIGSKPIKTRPNESTHPCYNLYSKMHNFRAA
jgi:hypothetical protein